jgi:hypothetical protein
MISVHQSFLQILPVTLTEAGDASARLLPSGELSPLLAITRLGWPPAGFIGLTQGPDCYASNIRTQTIVPCNTVQNPYLIPALSPPIESKEKGSGFWVLGLAKPALLPAITLDGEVWYGDGPTTLRDPGRLAVVKSGERWDGEAAGVVSFCSFWTLVGDCCDPRPFIAFMLDGF